MLYLFTIVVNFIALAITIWQACRPHTEESHLTPFNAARVTDGLPAWLVSELDHLS